MGSKIIVNLCWQIEPNLKTERSSISLLLIKNMSPLIK